MYFNLQSQFHHLSHSWARHANPKQKTTLTFHLRFKWAARVHNTSKHTHSYIQYKYTQRATLNQCMKRLMFHSDTHRPTHAADRRRQQGKKPASSHEFRWTRRRLQRFVHFYFSRAKVKYTAVIRCWWWCSQQFLCIYLAGATKRI